MAKKKKKAQRKTKRKAKRKCGICRKPGHNRSNCPTLVQHGKYEPEVKVRERTPQSKSGPQVHVRPLGTPPEELHRKAVQRDPTLGSTPHATLPEIKHLVHFANTILVAASQADRYSVDDRQALCKSAAHHLHNLIGGHLYVAYLDLLRSLQGAGNRDQMHRILDEITRLVELYGGELHIPQQGDEFDYDLHMAVGNHPDVTPGQKLVRQVAWCGFRFGGHRQPAGVIVTQSKPSRRLRRRTRRRNPGVRRRWNRNPSDAQIRQEMVDLFSARRRNPSDAQIRQEMFDLFSARRNPWEAPELCESCFQDPCVCPCPNCDQDPCVCLCKVCGEQPCRCCAICGHAPRGEGFGAVMNLEGRACRCTCHSWNANKPRRRY